MINIIIKVTNHQLSIANPSPLPAHYLYLIND